MNFGRNTIQFTAEGKTRRQGICLESVSSGENHSNPNTQKGYSNKEQEEGTIKSCQELATDKMSG